jgi:hypothetical protein
MVVTATTIARYVEPQMMYTAAKAAMINNLDGCLLVFDIIIGAGKFQTIIWIV